MRLSFIVYHSNRTFPLNKIAELFAKGGVIDCLSDGSGLGLVCDPKHSRHRGDLALKDRPLGKRAGAGGGGFPSWDLGEPLNGRI